MGSSKTERLDVVPEAQISEERRDLVGLRDENAVLTIGAALNI